MAVTNATILVRRGNIADYDKTKLLTGEPVLIIDEKEFEICVAPGTTIRAAKAEYLEEIKDACELSETNAKTSEINAMTQAENAQNYASNALNSETKAEEYKDYVEGAVNALPPILSIDFETGELLADGGLLILSINAITGNLEYLMAGGN